MLSKVLSCAVVGLEGELVEVEVDITNYGLPTYHLVGLPDAAVKESWDRVRSALRNSGCSMPSKGPALPMVRIASAMKGRFADSSKLMTCRGRAMILQEECRCWIRST